MTFKEWLKYAVKNRSNDFRQLLPELKFNDGTELSVQASEFHMCYPKEKLAGGEYERVDKRGKVLVNSQEQFCKEAREAVPKNDPVGNQRVFIPAEPVE